MPNGIMVGDGSKENPLIVMDGYDFDALRNVIADTIDNVKYVELGNNINLSAFPLWNPIADKFFNFDGKGFQITDFIINIVASSSSMSCGLFGRLNPTEYVRNVIVEGQIIVVNSVGMSSTAGNGLFAGTIHSQSPLGVPLIVENIEAYGEISYKNSGSNTAYRSWGGVIGSVVTTTGTGGILIRQCMFKGVVYYHCTGSPGTITDSAASSFGGILGGVSTGPATIEACLSDVIIFIYTGASTRQRYVASICGYLHNTTLIACIGKIRTYYDVMTSVDTTAGRNPNMMLNICGLVGFSAGTSQIKNCVAFIDFINDPPNLSPPTCISGFNGSRTGSTSASVQVLTSYTVIRYQNPNDKPLPVSFYIYGAGYSGSHSNSFYDADELAVGWSGTVNQSELGRTTVQLQSKTYLESQGWVFVNE